MPSISKRNPIITTNQKIPPLRNIHAAFQNSKLFPNSVQEYVAELQASKIAPTKRISPNKTSTHLFIVLLHRGSPLKRFLCWIICYKILKNP